ncbi:unnamed protein product [Prunus armeniaca]
MLAREHVIYVDLHSLSNLLLDDLVHEPPVRCSGILQTKGRDLLALCTSFDYERRLCFVVFMHHDLIIVGVRVHEAEQLVPRV